MGKSSTEEARLTAEILNNPKFQKMARQKSFLGWSFSAVMFSVYTAFIWIIGTRPDLLGRKVSEGGVTTWGIYAGIAVIVFSFLITLAYVWLANGYFEKTTREVVREVQGDASCTNVQEHA